MRFRRTLGVAFGLAVLLAAASPAHAAGRSVRIRHIDTGAFPSVAVTVSVYGQVSPDGLQVTEDGRPVSIMNVRPLAAAGRTFDVVLAIDTSDSVAGAPLAAAAAAAEAFVRQLPSGIGVGVLTFSDRPTVLHPVTDDHQAVLQALASISGTRHGTVLYDAVGAAADMSSGPAQHNILLLTDGSDLGSSSTLESAIRAAQKHSTTVFTVGLGTHADDSVLRTLADRTGGSFTPAIESNLSSVYQQLAGQLTNQYVVTYRSSAPGGAEVTVRVEAPGVSDQSFIQMPRLATLPPPGFSLTRWFSGAVGLVLAVGLAFAAVFALTLFVVGGTLRARRDRALALAMAAAPSPVDTSERSDDGGGSASSWIPEPLAQAAERAAELGGIDARLESTLERAGVAMTPGEFLAGSLLAVFLAGLVAAIIFQSILFALALALAAGCLPALWLRRRVSKRIQMLTDQLPDILMILSSSMRAGQSFLQALDAASREVGNPSGPEFARVVTEIRLGRPSEEALTALAERVGTEEFKWAVLAVNIQRQVGGNLTEILDTLAETVRERATLRRQVRVLSAEGRLSMKIFVTLPPLLVLYISWTNPDYMRLLWTTRAGGIMIAAASVLMVLGALSARKIVRIDV